MNEENTDQGLLHRELARVAKAGAVIDVYRERLVPGGMMGRVIQWSEHVLMIERLSEDYAYDGLSAIRPGDITRIRADDRELRALPKLISNECVDPLDDVALLEISASITMLSRRYSAVAVHVEGIVPEAVFVGVPEGLDDDFLVLGAWGTARSADSYRLTIRLSEITRVDADTTYIRRLHDVRRAEGL